MTLDDFMSLFRYKPEWTFWVGVERERFLTDRHGILVPRAQDVLVAAHRLDPEHARRYTCELSACQMEGVTDALPFERISDGIEQVEYTLAQAAESLGLRQSFMAVAPADMPLDVYPDARYQEIAHGMSQERLLMACRIAATHVHIGMRDHGMALRVYNHVVKHADELCALGDRSNGERLRIYREMNPDCMPRPFESWAEFHADAVENGYVKDPKRCWKLVRMSIHGTLEFRMADAMASTEEVVSFARRCHNLCDYRIAAWI